jgi:hypothetical protein
MGYTQRITETEPLVGTVITTGSIGSWYTDAISLSSDSGRRFRFLVNVPTLSGGAKVDFNVQTAATSGGTYTALSGCSIAQEGTGGKLFQIEVSTEYLVNAVSTAKYMKGYLIVTSASANPSVSCYGADAAHLPTTDTGTGVQTPNTVYG